MLFNSHVFIFLFLPVTLTTFFLLSKLRLIKLATVSLVAASLVFYSYWNVKYLPLLLASIIFNFTTGKLIITSKTAKSLQAKFLTVFGVGANLLLLGYYKYANFFIDNANIFLHNKIIIPTIILPLGISFFTFTQIAFLVDAYRGETKNYTFLTYCLFVTFFPHLIAGPILYHKDIIPQFHRLRNFVFSNKNMALGITIFSIGLFKKIIIADKLSIWVSNVFNNADFVNIVQAWIGAVSYTFQLYFDFSGYSDMAVGLGLMLNIILPLNFNSPYKAKSIIDFWRRWHMTLSFFLRNYLYFPLGGNRCGEIRRLINIFITMFLGGIWHGAGWTFVLWGGLHGVYLVINHLWRKINISLPNILAWILTFLAIVFAWVFFRASSVNEGYLIFRAMTGIEGIDLSVASQAMPNFTGFSLIKKIMVLIILFLWITLLPNTQELARRFKPTIWWTIFVAGTATAGLFGISRLSEFLYFQF